MLFSIKAWTGSSKSSQPQSRHSPNHKMLVENSSQAVESFWAHCLEIQTFNLFGKIMARCRFTDQLYVASGQVSRVLSPALFETNVYKKKFGLWLGQCISQIFCEPNPRLCLILKLPTWEAQGDVSVVKKRPLYEDLYMAFSCQRALGPTTENAGN